jgi:hypothetical protein
MAIKGLTVTGPMIYFLRGSKAGLTPSKPTSPEMSPGTTITETVWECQAGLNACHPAVLGPRAE